jgi:hypothetical protein
MDALTRRCRRQLEPCGAELPDVRVARLEEVLALVDLSDQRELVSGAPGVARAGRLQFTDDGARSPIGERAAHRRSSLRGRGRGADSFIARADSASADRDTRRYATIREFSRSGGAIVHLRPTSDACFSVHDNAGAPRDRASICSSSVKYLLIGYSTFRASKCAITGPCGPSLSS